MPDADTIGRLFAISSAKLLELCSRLRIGAA
jgi:hypothetical protein